MNNGITLDKVKAVLDRVFNEGVEMVFLTKPGKTSFTLEEMRSVTLDAYLMGLSDVLDLIAGHSIRLEELLSKGGSAILVDPEACPAIIGVPKETVNYEDVPSEN